MLWLAMVSFLHVETVICAKMKVLVLECWDAWEYVLVLVDFSSKRVIEDSSRADDIRSCTGLPVS